MGQCGFVKFGKGRFGDLWSDALLSELPGDGAPAARPEGRAILHPGAGEFAVVGVFVVAQALQRALKDVLGCLVLAQGGPELRLGPVAQAEQPEGTLVRALVGLLRLKGGNALGIQGLTDLQTGRKQTGQAEGEFSVELNVDSIGMAFLGLDGGNDRH